MRFLHRRNELQAQLLDPNTNKRFLKLRRCRWSYIAPEAAKQILWAAKARVSGYEARNFLLFLVLLLEPFVECILHSYVSLSINWLYKQLKIRTNPSKYLLSTGAVTIHVLYSTSKTYSEKAWKETFNIWVPKRKSIDPRLRAECIYQDNTKQF